MVEGEPVFELGDLIGDGVGIAGVAFEHLDGDGAAVGGAQQAIDDLHLALLAVPVVAALGQRAAAAFDIARRHVVEHQRPALQMALGERGLDRALALVQPVERGVEFVLVDLAQGQFDAEARGGGGRIERLGGGELGGRRDDAADDHGQDQIARPVGLAAFFGPSRRSRPMARAVPSTAATAPCGNERSTVKACWPGGSTTPPFSTPRRPSTCSAGQSHRLSSVRLRMLLPSR